MDGYNIDETQLTTEVATPKQEAVPQINLQFVPLEEDFVNLGAQGRYISMRNSLDSLALAVQIILNTLVEQGKAIQALHQTNSKIVIPTADEVRAL